MRALKEAGAVGVDELEDEWWSGGWRGYRSDDGIKGLASGTAAEPPRAVGREQLPGGRVRRYLATVTG